MKNSIPRKGVRRSKSRLNAPYITVSILKASPQDRTQKTIFNRKRVTAIIFDERWESGGFSRIRGLVDACVPSTRPLSTSRPKRVTNDWLNRSWKAFTKDQKRGDVNPWQCSRQINCRISKTIFYTATMPVIVPIAVLCRERFLDPVKNIGTGRSGVPFGCQWRVTWTFIDRFIFFNVIDPVYVSDIYLLFRLINTYDFSTI